MQRSHILPVAVKFVGIQRIIVVLAVRDHVLAKIEMRLVRIFHQSFPQSLPVKDIDTHGSQVAARFRRFLLKIDNFLLIVCDHNAKAACLLPGHRHNRDRHVRIVRLVEIQHRFVIHLIDVVSGKDQHVLRIIAVHVLNILKDSVRRAGVPLRTLNFFVRRKYGHTAYVSVQIPGDTDPDVGIQPQGLILRKYTNRIHSGIDTVAEWEINNSVLSTKSNRRFCNFRGQNAESASLTTCQEHGNHFFFNHSITSIFLQNVEFLSPSIAQAS